MCLAICSMAISSLFRAGLHKLQYQLTARWLRPTVIGLASHRSESSEVLYILEHPSHLDRVLLHRCLDIVSTRSNSDHPSSLVLHADEGFLGRRSQRRFSEQLAFEARNRDSRKILLIPVGIFWGHQPDRELSLWKTILSEDWSGTSALRRLLNFLFNPHHLLVEFGPPILLKNDESNLKGLDLSAKKARRLIKQQFKSMRRTAIGPDLSHRRTLVNQLLAMETVNAAIVERSLAHGHDKVMREAHKIIDQLISHQSYRVIRFFNVVLTWLWQKLYNGIEVRQLQAVKAASLNHQVVYTPCHRSHMDYLLLSYVLYHNGLTPPHIAAGDNLNLPLVGPLLRRAGAFFMRRQFGNDELYKAIFSGYLRLMLHKGHSLEYFIEGGRSRTGRMRVPRRGMLGMTLRSAWHSPAIPLAFVPVHFGYDRVFEVKSYLSELGGMSKQKESLLDLFNAWRKLGFSYGKVQVTFGEPVYFNPNTERAGVGASAAESGPLPEQVAQLANEINRAINGATSVSPMTLFATALSLTQRGAIDRQRLNAQLDLLRSLVPSSALTEACARSSAPVLADIAMAQLSLVHDEGSGCPSVRVSEITRAELSYHANDINHMLIVPSLIAQMLILSHRLRLDQVEAAISLFVTLFSEELFFEIEANHHDFESILDHLNEHGIVERRESEIALITDNPIGYSNLFDLSQFVRPFLVRYLLLAEALKSLPGNLPLAVDRARDMGSTLLPALIGHYPWFEKDYDLVVAEKLTAVEKAFEGYSDRLIDQATALLPPEVVASVNDALRSFEMEHVEATASPT